MFNREWLYVFWVPLVIVAFSAGMLIRPHLTPLDIPYGDGWGFATRAITLHGLLHSGQWAAFWDMLISPSTITLVPNYILFWLLPVGWADGMTYGVIHTLAWHALIWLGTWGLLRELGLVRLMPAVLLLTLGNNNVLDYTLYGYMDMNFAACALVSLWLLVRAWIRQTPGAALWAGAGAGFLFFVKPGNTFVFLPCYAVAVVAFVGLRFFELPPSERRNWFRKVVYGSLLWLAAFLPLLVLACGWTLIPNVIDRVVGWAGKAGRPTANSPSAVLDFFYFPLCLSYFYSFLVLGLSALLAGVSHRWLRWARQESPVPVDAVARCSMVGLFIGFIVAWGLVFSFVFPYKIIRSLPLMLPILWISLLGWGSMRWRLTRSFMVFAALYFAVAHAQFSWGVAGVKQNRGTEHYALEGDWLNRLPAQVSSLEEPARLTHSLLRMLADCGITQGKVAVGTEMLYWNNASLNWVAQIPYLQKGQEPALNFVTLVDGHGDPIISQMEGAVAFMLVVHPAVQYSREVFDFNLRTAQYATRKWASAVARRIETFTMGDGRPAVVLIAFSHPLQKSTLAAYWEENFSGRRADKVEGEMLLMDHRLPWSEYWRILRGGRNGLNAGLIEQGK